MFKLKVAPMLNLCEKYIFIGFLKYLFSKAEVFKGSKGLCMYKLQSRYEALQNQLLKRVTQVTTSSNMDLTYESNALAERFGISKKKRSGSEYVDVAFYLLKNYEPEVAYFIGVELNEQFERKLGYPPIGQIMVAMENEGSKNAARWITCALCNFPKIETARLAFSVIKSPAMRSLVQTDLSTEDIELAEYVCSVEISKSPSNVTSTMTKTPSESQVKHKTHLSDGIERMPRLLTDAERKADRLFLHLQILAIMVLFLSPILGGVIFGWAGIGIGLVFGLVVRIWMRRSMGLRGLNPNDGFFIRMRERANGARRGILEALIENIRQQPFTQEKCILITRAWDDMRKRIETMTSEEEKHELIKAFDAEIKRISYDQNV